MKIPIVNRFRKSNQWPARALIIKPMKGDPEITWDRARRVDDKENKDDVVSHKTRFELKSGFKTAPVPYKHIHNTDGEPLVIFKSPEKGTYVPFEFGRGGDEDISDILLALKELEKDIDEDKTEELARLELFLEKQKGDTDLELEKALDNQEWLRWGKQILLDIRHLTQTDKSWLEKHATTIILGLVSMLVITIGILNYMAMGDMSEALKLIAENSIIPVAASGKLWNRKGR